MKTVLLKTKFLWLVFKTFCVWFNNRPLSVTSLYFHWFVVWCVNKSIEKLIVSLKINVPFDGNFESFFTHFSQVLINERQKIVWKSFLDKKCFQTKNYFQHRIEKNCGNREKTSFGSKSLFDLLTHDWFTWWCWRIFQQTNLFANKC